MPKNKWKNWEEKENGNFYYNGEYVVLTDKEKAKVRKFMPKKKKKIKEPCFKALSCGCCVVSGRYAKEALPKKSFQGLCSGANYYVSKSKTKKERT